MPTLSTILLSIKGDVRKTNIQYDEELTIEIIQKHFKKKDEPENVCCYEYDNKYIFIFGYTKGKKGTENKTELPDPYTSTLIYGDALIIVSTTHNWETPIPFTIEQWNSFYNEEEEIEDIKDECDIESDIIEEVDGKVSAVESTMRSDFSTVRSDVDAKVSTVLTDVSSVRADVSSIDAEVTAIKSEVIAMKTQLSELKDLICSLRSV